LYGVSSSGACNDAHANGSRHGHGHATKHADGDSHANEYARAYRDANEYARAYRDGSALHIGGGAGHPAATGGTRTAAGSRRNILTAA
jgi:hypothetical protein